MKLALHILQAVAAILTLIGCAFGLSSRTTDKKIAVYFFLAAACAWVAVIIWRLRSKHLENQIDLSVAPRGELKDSTPKIALTEQTALLWTHYIQDVFNDVSPEVIWRWHYKPEIDNSPRNIRPFCPDCQEPTRLNINHVSKSNTDRQWVLMCPSLNHVRLYYIPAKLGPHLEQFPDIKERVRQKLADGSWLEVVNRQRQVEGLPPIKN